MKTICLIELPLRQKGRIRRRKKEREINMKQVQLGKNSWAHQNARGKNKRIVL